MAAAVTTLGALKIVAEAIPVLSVPTFVFPAVAVIGIGVVGTMIIAEQLTKKDPPPPRTPPRNSTAKRQVSSREYLEILTEKQFEELLTVTKHAQILREIHITDADPDDERAHVVSLVRNAQRRTLKLYHWGSFSGNFLAPPPVSLVENPIFLGLFLHQGCDPDGSRGYVIYGTNDDDGPPLLYILAWSKPAKGSPKVYVQAGLLPNMVKKPYNLIKQLGNIDDLLNELRDQIRQKLIQLLEEPFRQKFNELTDSDQCSSYDPETGAEAEAAITSACKGSSWAMLAAKFFRRQN